MKPVFHSPHLEISKALDLELGEIFPEADRQAQYRAMAVILEYTWQPSLHPTAWFARGWFAKLASRNRRDDDRYVRIDHTLEYKKAAAWAAGRRQRIKYVYPFMAGWFAWMKVWQTVFLALHTGAGTIQ